jgi:hypothetical protein
MMTVLNKLNQVLGNFSKILTSFRQANTNILLLYVDLPKAIQ